MKKRGDKPSSRKTKPGLQSPIKGTVKARTCKHCGHHEIGIVTGSGEFVALKPGMRIAILSEGKSKG